MSLERISALLGATHHLLDCVVDILISTFDVIYEGDHETIWDEEVDNLIDKIRCGLGDEMSVRIDQVIKADDAKFAASLPIDHLGSYFAHLVLIHSENNKSFIVHRDEIENKIVAAIRDTLLDEELVDLNLSSFCPNTERNRVRGIVFSYNDLYPFLAGSILFELLKVYDLANDPIFGSMGPKYIDLIDLESRLKLVGQMNLVIDYMKLSNVHVIVASEINEKTIIKATKLPGAIARLILSYDLYHSENTVITRIMRLPIIREDDSS